MCWTNLLRYQHHLLKQTVLLSLKVTLYKAEKPSPTTKKSKSYTTVGIRGDLCFCPASTGGRCVSPGDSSLRPSHWDLLANKFGFKPLSSKSYVLLSMLVSPAPLCWANVWSFCCSWTTSHGCPKTPCLFNPCCSSCRAPHKESAQTQNSLFSQ